MSLYSSWLFPRGKFLQDKIIYILAKLPSLKGVPTVGVTMGYYPRVHRSLSSLIVRGTVHFRVLLGNVTLEHSKYVGLLWAFYTERRYMAVAFKLFDHDP